MQIQIRKIWHLARLSEVAQANRQPTPLDKLLNVEMKPEARLMANANIKAIANEIARIEAIRIETLKRYEAEIETMCNEFIELPCEQFSIAELGDTKFDGSTFDALSFLFTESTEAQ